MSIKEIKVESAIYRFEGISDKEADILAGEVLTDPVIQTSSTNPKRNPDETELGYKKGVTDPKESSLLKAANLVGINPQAASSSEITDRKPSQIEEIIYQSPDTLLVSGQPQEVDIVDMTNLSNDDLTELSEKRSLFLNLAEMKVIQNHFISLNRQPTDLELETFAQTWSEHCKHKTFNAVLLDESGNTHTPLMTRIKQTSEKYFEKAGVVSAFTDNAGGIVFYEGMVVIAKGETHNSPVGIDPYAGSLTKNGGVYRDIAGFGKGGESILSIMVNNFADPEIDVDSLPPGCLHPHTLLTENSRGEREYGNPMGIPTHAISLHFHKNFAPKPTSLGVVIGKAPVEHAQKESPQKGDLIVSVGGRTGRDGIHGATFSSGEMSHKTHETHSTAVQLGDPILEKKMFDALLLARDMNLIRSITDCGAGGYSSAVGEMADGVGATINLDNIPVKYQGLAPWEKWLSESQERMVLAIPPESLDAFLSVCRAFDNEASIIGKFSGDNQLRITENGKTVGNINLEFLHHGLPQRYMQMRRLERKKMLQEHTNGDSAKMLRDKLADLNICSKEEMHRMYDQTVQASTVMAPYVGVNENIPSEASVVTPIPGKPYGIVTAHAANPHKMLENPHFGAKWAFAQAAAKFTAAGGNIDEAAGVDNYIWPFPDEESLYDLHTATDGLVEMIELLEIPMVSGKDSLSSTYKAPDGQTIKAPPTLNITIFGRIPNVEFTTTPDIKNIGSTLCLIGSKNLNRLTNNLRSVRNAIQSNKVLSAKAVGEGGLAVALTQMCIGGDCGVELDTDKLDIFSETAGKIIVEVVDLETAKDLFVDSDYSVLGSTKQEKQLTINNILDENIDELREIWQAPMKKILKNV